MKALQITGYGDLAENLKISNVDKPEIDKNEVLIQVKAAALNPIDFKIVNGSLKELLDLDLPSGIGYDFSGEVVEAGAAIKDFEPGDAVFGRVPQEYMGTLAEYVKVDPKVIAKKPDNVTFEKAASLPLVGLTAIQALEKVGLKEGDRILIHAGSGGVGSFAIQYAKTKNAIVYTTTSSSNLDWVKALGADRVIDYKNEDYREVATDLDIVFDTLGEDFTFEAFGIIKQGGRVASIAGPPDVETAGQMGMQDYEIPEKLKTLIDKKSATYKFTWMQPNATQLNEIKQMVEDRSIRPVVDLIYPFEDSVKAFEYLAKGHAQGKVIVRI